MSTHTALRSVDKVISGLLIEAKLKGPLQVGVCKMWNTELWNSGITLQN